MKVDLQDIGKGFAARRRVLDGIDLAIADGEFLALLGPSGSGKTTLLRVLAGLDFPDRGAILFDGRDMAAVPARARGVGMVFQHYALFPHMNVARNVAFGLEIRPRRHRPAAADIRRRVQDLLDLLEIGDLRDRRPAQLSGGQRQRVALARALAIEPGLLLLDEPFGALDAQVRKTLRIWLRDLHRRMGLTSVFVTHDQAEAMEMADRVAVLRAGRIEQADTPCALYADPATPFVHQFLGDSIRLDCMVRDGLARLDGACGLSLPTPCRPGAGVMLIRPHDIGLLPGAGPARVTDMRAAGPWTRVALHVAGKEMIVLRRLGEFIPAIGQGCGLDLSKGRVYPIEPGCE